MAVFLANLTLQAIDAAIAKDGGATYRKHLKRAMTFCNDAYDDRPNSGPRSHLGASLIGRDCDRQLWYSFRWATDEKVEPRMQRLWNRGHLEEGRFIALLQTIGCEVRSHDAQGRQFRISLHNGHFGGSCDAVIRGIPEDPNNWLLAEFKTYNDKQFQKLVADGVRMTKFDHYIQMNMYMLHLQLPGALYLAVNKNDDSLYGELIACDHAAVEINTERARALVGQDPLVDFNTPPKRVSSTPGWFVCRFCTYKGVCHLNEVPARNCRTCLSAKPVENAKWICTFHKKELTYAEQRAGCYEYKRAL